MFERLHAFWLGLKRLLNGGSDYPEDPYAYVGAPRKPGPPYRRARASEPLE